MEASAAGVGGGVSQPVLFDMGESANSLGDTVGSPVGNGAATLALLGHADFTRWRALPRLSGSGFSRQVRHHYDNGHSIARPGLSHSTQGILNWLSSRMNIWRWRKGYVQQYTFPLAWARRRQLDDSDHQDMENPEQLLHGFDPNFVTRTAKHLRGDRNSRKQGNGSAARLRRRGPSPNITSSASSIPSDSTPVRPRDFPLESGEGPAGPAYGLSSVGLWTAAGPWRSRPLGRAHSGTEESIAGRISHPSVHKAMAQHTSPAPQAPDQPPPLTMKRNRPVHVRQTVEPGSQADYGPSSVSAGLSGVYQRTVKSRRDPWSVAENALRPDFKRAGSSISRAGRRLESRTMGRADARTVVSGGIGKSRPLTFPLVSRHTLSSSVMAGTLAWTREPSDYGMGRTVGAQQRSASKVNGLNHSVETLANLLPSDLAGWGTAPESITTHRRLPSRLEDPREPSGADATRRAGRTKTRPAEQPVAPSSRAADLADSANALGSQRVNAPSPNPDVGKVSPSQNAYNPKASLPAQRRHGAETADGAGGKPAARGEHSKSEGTAPLPVNTNLEERTLPDAGLLNDRTSQFMRRLRQVEERRTPSARNRKGETAARPTSRNQPSPATDNRVDQDSHGSGNSVRPVLESVVSPDPVSATSVGQNHLTEPVPKQPVDPPSKAPSPERPEIRRAITTRDPGSMARGIGSRLGDLLRWKHGNLSLQSHDGWAFQPGISSVARTIVQPKKWDAAVLDPHAGGEEGTASSLQGYSAHERNMRLRPVPVSNPVSPSDISPGRTDQGTRESEVAGLNPFEKNHIPATEEANRLEQLDSDGVERTTPRLIGAAIRRLGSKAGTVVRAQQTQKAQTTSAPGRELPTAAAYSREEELIVQRHSIENEDLGIVSSGRPWHKLKSLMPGSWRGKKATVRPFKSNSGDNKISAYSPPTRSPKTGWAHSRNTDAAKENISLGARVRQSLTLPFGTGALVQGSRDILRKRGGLSPTPDVFGNPLKDAPATDSERPSLKPALLPRNAELAEKRLPLKTIVQKTRNLGYGAAYLAQLPGGILRRSAGRSLVPDVFRQKLKDASVTDSQRPSLKPAPLPRDGESPGEENALRALTQETSNLPLVSAESARITRDILPDSASRSRDSGALDDGLEAAPAMASSHPDVPAAKSPAVKEVSAATGPYSDEGPGGSDPSGIFRSDLLGTLHKRFRSGRIIGPKLTRAFLNAKGRERGWLAQIGQRLPSTVQSSRSVMSRSLVFTPRIGNSLPKTPLGSKRSAEPEPVGSSHLETLTMSFERSGALRPSALSLSEDSTPEVSLSKESTQRFPGRRSLMPLQDQENEIAATPVGERWPVEVTAAGNVRAPVLAGVLRMFRSTRAMTLRRAGKRAVPIGAEQLVEQAPETERRTAFATLLPMRNAAKSTSNGEFFSQYQPLAEAPDSSKPRGSDRARQFRMLSWPERAVRAPRLVMPPRRSLTLSRIGQAVQRYPIEVPANEGLTMAGLLESVNHIPDRRDPVLQFSQGSRDRSVGRGPSSTGMTDAGAGLTLRRQAAAPEAKEEQPSTIAQPSAAVQPRSQRRLAKASSDQANECVARDVTDFKGWEIEFLASRVFTYLQRRLDIERERHGRAGFNPWL